VVQATPKAKHFLDLATLGWPATFYFFLIHILFFLFEIIFYYYFFGNETSISFVVLRFLRKNPNHELNII
jgi:hypothetical protein